MKIDSNSEKPIFLQISDGIEDAILTGAFPETEQIPSITEFAASYKINPATALKGINLLVNENILYKKRGVGMFVKEGATKKLEEKRKERFFENYVAKLVEEAQRLNLTAEDVKTLIERGFQA